MDWEAYRKNWTPKAVRQAVHEAWAIRRTWAQASEWAKERGYSERIAAMLISYQKWLDFRDEMLKRSEALPDAWEYRQIIDKTNPLRVSS